MTYYSIERYRGAAGTVIDSDDEQVACQIIREEYDEDGSYAYVLLKCDSTPTHILIDGVLYKLEDPTP